MLKKLFPPTNELTTFVIATVLISLFFYMEGWYGAAAEVFDGYFSSTFTDMKRADNILDEFLQFFAGIFLVPIIILCCIIAPLVLPFVRYDLRQFCIGILVIDLILITFQNVSLAYKTRDTLHLITATYCVLWVLYFYWCMKTEKTDHLISCEKSNPKASITAAIIAIAAVFIAITYFDIHWITAYSFSLIFIPNFVTAIFPAPKPTDIKNSFSSR